MINLQLFHRNPLQSPTLAYLPSEVEFPLGWYWTHGVNQYPIMFCPTGITACTDSSDSGSRIKPDSWQEWKIPSVGWVMKTKVHSVCQALLYFLYEIKQKCYSSRLTKLNIQQTLSALLSLCEGRPVMSIRPSCNLKSGVNKKVVSLSYRGFVAASNGNSRIVILRDFFFNGKENKNKNLSPRSRQELC